MPYSNDNNSTGVSLSDILFSFMLEKYIVCYVCGLFQRPWVRIFLSAEEDNLSPFDSKIACLCTEIDNNIDVYRQSQLWKPTGSGFEWAECSLIIGTGYWVQIFSLILDSSDGLSASIQSVGDSKDPGFESCIQLSKTTRLLSIRKSPACVRASKLTTKICIAPTYPSSIQELIMQGMQQKW